MGNGSGCQAPRAEGQWKNPEEKTHNDGIRIPELELFETKRLIEEADEGLPEADVQLLSTNEPLAERNGTIPTAAKLLWISAPA